MLSASMLSFSKSTALRINPLIAVNYIIKNADTMYYGGINVCPEKAYKKRTNR